MHQHLRVLENEANTIFWHVSETERRQKSYTNIWTCAVYETIEESESDSDNDRSLCPRNRIHELEIKERIKIIPRRELVNSVWKKAIIN